MSEMSDELKAAVERWRAVDYAGPFAWAMEAADEKLLAGAYIAYIDEQERIAAERALLMSFPWLESIGFRHNDGDEDYHWINCGPSASYDVQVWFRSGRICLSNPEGKFTIGNAKTTNCGNMLDLLAALKIETKGT